MEIRCKVMVLFSAMYILMSATIAPVVSGPPYYHEEGNVNYPSSYFEDAYITRGVGVDDYITIIDIALIIRSWFITSGAPWGIDWNLYNLDADIPWLDGLNDGIVDQRDLAKAVMNWGLNYHYSPFETENGPVKVKVVPPRQPMQVNEQFNVSVEIDAKKFGINTYEFTLSWYPELLDAISVVGGGFISGEGAELSSIIIDNDEGYLYVGDMLSDPIAQSGTGILAIITFECLGKGKVTLDLSSRLFDINLYAIRHKDIDDEVKQRP